MRVLAPGAWVNTPSVTISARMFSRAAATLLQPQVEVRPLTVPFTGHPTGVGARVTYSGAPVLGVVPIAGLRDGVAYHWRLRVRDAFGSTSAWTGPHGAALRVHLEPPPAPTLRLLTATRSGDWVATRRLNLHWSRPADPTGIRGYSYTLARGPYVQPLMHWRTWLTGKTVQAGGEGLWYFTVRALNNAHTWGPPARLALRIDTTTPRLRIMSAPVGAFNPRHVHPFLRLQVTDWSRVRVAIVTAHGRVVRSILTRWHQPGYRLTIDWDGKNGRGMRVPNGRYYARIVAFNRAGRLWSASRPLLVDGTPPTFTGYGLTQTGTFNLYNTNLDGPEVITATLDTSAHVRVEALHAGHVMRVWTFGATTAASVISATWDGRTEQGAVMPGGAYTFRANAVDAAGNHTTRNLGWVVLDRRRIVVSLNQQRLWALDADRVLLTALVTTGGPELPTPTGDFQIIDRESPFTFHSPYATTSPFWYPDSPANFALLFQINGYFIHDAPWRSYYGPGSNNVDGIPGSNTTGTHGCVNVPYNEMAWLFNWATMYTPVQVRQDFTPHPQ